MKRVTIAAGAVVKLREKVYELVDTTQPLHGVTSQVGEVVCVTLDDKRDVLVKRSDCTEES